MGIHFNMSLRSCSNPAKGLFGRGGVLAAILALLALPASVFAAGGENVSLTFSSTDYIYLFVSLAFGAIALIIAFGIRNWVLKQSAGPESMQTVGQAIIDGASAYLRQQIRTMSIFVGLIFLLLTAMYWNTYGPVLAIGTAVCFLAGVAASYIAGAVGMGMAVRANMRTAFAALSSYGLSLQIAFRAGAVAGLITVGMGLLGATLIFLFFSGDAMKLLVGFGFGGSLAALFMRVGGGIYTKAADVGADLVGKVEAGIPEDDPRNPAVIADNVGDNVGDCAGMAADVFESYEVTLVAAIILGAATAAIFDTATWTKLVMFALMARGVGILASIIGINFVKADDSEKDPDPLGPISKGYKVSLGIAAVATIGLGYFMMGGMPGSEIKSNLLKSSQQVMQPEVRLALDAQKRIAEANKVAPSYVSSTAVSGDEQLKKEIPDQMLREQAVSAALSTPADKLGEVVKLEGYSKISFTDTKNPVLSYAVMPAADPNVPAPPNQAPVTFKERYEKSNLVVMKVDVVEAGMPKRTFFLGPDPKDKGEEQINKAITDAKTANNGTTIELAGVYPVEFYANHAGDVVAAVSGKAGEKFNPGALQSLTGFRLEYIKTSVADYTKQQKAIEAASAELTKKQQELSTKFEAANKKQTDAEAKKDSAASAAARKELAALQEEAMKLSPATQLPTPTVAQMAIVEHKVVEWWKFVACILFGIIMAFAFEKLTDHYVSMNKKPVQELGQVATTGPAPMIITGFASGLESSVASVVAIVVCLIAPVWIFNPAEYGGYLLSFYGIALVGLGLLTTTGYILAMDTFGPISDNAQGVYEMSGEGHDNAKGARAVQLLDAAGNTTKALTKGFAIATAVVAAVALFHAFVEAGKLSTVGMRLEVPEIFLGLLIGGAAPYLFSAFSINAVGRAAFQLINEVRRQFRNDPGIMAGTSKPDYGSCVAIVTAAAQKELLGPGILAIASPIMVAFVFSIGKEPVLINGSPYNLVGAQALGGFLAGTILSGQLLAVLLANSGGMWDNAKKLIEDGLHGGKGTDAHKAAVVCDTVGDPFKDTAGPALNPLIKVMNLVALLVAPLVIQPMGDAVYTIVALVCAAAIAFAIHQSKKGSMSSEMQAAMEDAAKHDAKSE